MTAPTVPAAPSTTPAWLIKAVALVLALVGPALDYWDPSGKINSSAAQAAVVVGFLVVAAAIFLVHVVLSAVHEYGWSKNALVATVDESGTELRMLLDEAKPLVEQAKPALDAIGPLGNLDARLGELEHKVNQVPTVDKDAVKAAVGEVLGGLIAPAAPPAPVAEPAAPKPEVVTGPIQTTLGGTAPAK